MADAAAHELARRFHEGETFAALLAREKQNSDMWEAVFRRASVAEAAMVRLRSLRRDWNLLVINEPWCGDSLNVLPFLGRLETVSPRIHMRMIGRDANPDLMDAHLTGRSRSIPVVMVLDDTFTERGWWGPRPGPLQQWVVSEGLALPRPERYRQVRTWYARDRGATVVSEILSIIESAEMADAEAAG